MKLKIAVVLVVFFAAIAGVLLANVTRTLPFATLRYEASAPDSGKVLVEIVQDEKGQVTSGRVLAFEREFALPLDRLHRREHERWAGVFVDLDSGMLGRTLYVTLLSAEWTARMEIVPDQPVRVSLRERQR